MVFSLYLAIIMIFLNEEFCFVLILIILIKVDKVRGSANLDTKLLCVNIINFDQR